MSLKMDEMSVFLKEILLQIRDKDASAKMYSWIVLKNIHFIRKNKLRPLISWWL